MNTSMNIHQKIQSRQTFFSWLFIETMAYHTYKLDAETKVTKRFRNPRARGCSVPSEARALLRAHGFLNRLVTVGQGV